MSLTGLLFSRSFCIMTIDSYQPDDFSSDSQVEVGKATHTRSGLITVVGCILIKFKTVRKAFHSICLASIILVKHIYLVLT